MEINLIGLTLKKDVKFIKLILELRWEYFYIKMINIMEDILFI